MSEKRDRPVRTKHRSKPAKMVVKDGKLIILCPFCEEDHPIDVQNVAKCGTVLQVNAVQEVWKNAACALCGIQDDRTLVKIGSQYRHIDDCSPGKKLYVIPPKPSFTARLFYFTPETLQHYVARRFGKVSIRLEREGKLLGYAWDRPHIVAP